MADSGESFLCRSCEVQMTNSCRRNSHYVSLCLGPKMSCCYTNTTNHMFTVACLGECIKHRWAGSEFELCSDVILADSTNRLHTYKHFLGKFRDICIIKNLGKCSECMRRLK